MRKIVLLLLLTMACLSWAQQPQEDKLGMLRPLVGSWEVVTQSKSPEGKWVASKPATSTVETLLDGKALQEKTTLHIGTMSFKMVVIYTYDPFRQVYRVAAVDHLSGMMDIAEGQIKDGVLVVDNLRAKTFFPWGEGKEGSFRLSKQFKDKDHFLVEAEVSFDAGKTWAPYTRSDYRRSIQKP